MELRCFLLDLFLLATLLVAPSRAVLKSYFYRFGEDAGDTPLASEDEISSPEKGLRVPIVFYGQIYDSIFVNSNGFVSFLTEIPNFFNVQFPLDYPVIAAFYSDVDPREAGRIWYRETSDPATVGRAKAEVKQHFSTAAAFEPKGVFIATFDGVGPYNQRADRINTYQLVLVTDGEESYALFHYADGGIQWLKGDGKNPSLSDARGQAGMVSGDGRFFELKGSGTDQVRSLDKWSNCGNPGVWMFRIGQLSVQENVHPPDLGVDDSTSQEGDVIQSCALGGSLCHSSAFCIDYTPGFCCSCEEEYMGNGINCVPKEEPIRVTGKIIGEVNGVALIDADLHSYVLTSEGRSYTALSRMPSQIGYDLQSITAIGTGIAWLFALPINNVKNGFSLTGGVLNRTVEVDFPQTGHRIEVQQQFKGLDVFNYVQVKTQLTGSIPTIPLGSKIEMDAFNEEYTKVKPGQLRARSSRVFRLKGQSIDTPFNVETTIDFDDCEWHVEEHETLRLKVPENIFIQYDSAEEIVRYALSAKLAPLEEIDPCVEGRQECGENSQCVVDGDTFRCVCARGYEELYDATLNKGICLDLNECSTNRDSCHPNAICTNTPGSFTCTCMPDFTGDGFNCEKIGSCDGIPCDPNAVCELRYGQAECVCLPGFIGDGLICTRATEVSSVQQQRSCVDYDVCSPFAICIYDDSVRSFRCECQPGYSGDGQTCQPEVPETCETARNCSPYGLCTKDGDEFRCQCIPGFIGDGYTCYEAESVIIAQQTEDEEPQQPYYPQEPDQPYQIEDLYPTEELHHGENSKPQLPKILDPECIFGVCWCPQDYAHNPQHNHCELIDASSSADGDVPQPYCGAAKCVCPQGYLYDAAGHACVAQPTASCHDVNNCHPNAQCMYDSYTQSYSCQCNAGYDGDGIYCNKLEVSCDRVDICHIHAQCVYDDQSLQHVCVCLAGYQGDGQVCTPQDECNSVQDCNVNAQCLYDTISQRYMCACNEGYEGDGHICNPRGGAGCNIINNCDPNANCIYDTYALGYRCQCFDGYEGDGLSCSPVEIGCNILQNCGQNAVCSYSVEAQGYRCTCQEGFEGDGFFCKSSKSCQFDPSVCHPQAACVVDQQSYEYKCQCQQGFTGDGLICQEAATHEDDILLLNQGLAVLRMPVDPRGGRSYIIHFDAFMTAVGSDIDCLAGRFYWTDVRSSSIRSSKYDGTERQPMVTQGNIGFPEDIAIDWVSKNIYWTDSSNDVVSVASIKDGKQRTVVEDQLVNPRGIAVHPGYGLLFWSDWNRLAPKIESSDLDGTNRRVVVDTDISLPNSLVVDYETNTLCWADAGTNKIECVGVHGSGRRVVTTGPRYPFGLTILGQNFFYTDWNDTKIHTVDRYSGVESASRVPPPGGSGKLYGISAVPSSCPPVSNACAVDDGGCPSTHLCLPNSRGGRTCACPDSAAQDEVNPCQTYGY